jgi:hypothetical protein
LGLDFERYIVQKMIIVSDTPFITRPALLEILFRWKFPHTACRLVVGTVAGLSLPPPSDVELLSLWRFLAMEKYTHIRHPFIHGLRSGHHY